MRLPQETIRAKRDGLPLDPEAIDAFVRGLTDGTVGEGQAAAFAMAVFFRGLSLPERVALTRAMAESGRVLAWDLPGPVLDKHSTGGVGDAVSLPLAPMVAACGGYVPMISGRGLGHTGGTLDKLGSIPGYDATPGLDAFRRVVRDVGCAIIGQTADLAPADRRLYAIRDVTGTVESLDLITASILSKKLAAGLQSLVLDVKTGSGAFMKSRAESRALAQALVSTANAAGCPTTALVTDMTQPLASSLGNALEVESSMAVLTGQDSGPLLELSVALGAELLATAGIADGEAKLRKAISSGEAAERFGRMVYALGGPLAFIDDWRRFLPEATVILEVPAPSDGVVTQMDGEALGLAVVDLGGGRRVESDVVDPAVGFSDVVRLGDKIAKGQPLLRVHAAREEQAAAAAQVVLQSITLGEDAPDAVPLVMERIT